MGKQGTPEQKKPAAAPAGAPEQHSHAPKGDSAPQAKKGSAGAKVGCHALACKEKDVRLGFCEEHFRQFKFGLISKTGEKVLDYEKKFEHYHKWLKAQKVA